MESSEELFYTENPEYTDEDVEMIMAMHNPVIINKDNLNWQDDTGEITVSYADAVDVDSQPEGDETLTENEVYLSTNAEDSIDNEKSQYYSILESSYQSEGEDYITNVDGNIIVNPNQTILTDMTGNGDYIVQNEEEKNEAPDENQVVLYHSDNPNEMYAVQIADDGNGNLKRYKYRIRQTPEGELEAIPGTIEVQDANIEDEILQQTTIEQNPIEQATMEEATLEEATLEEAIMEDPTMEDETMEDAMDEEQIDELPLNPKIEITELPELEQDEDVNDMNEIPESDHIETDESVEEQFEEAINEQNELVNNEDLTNLPEENFETEYLEEEYENPAEYLLENTENYEEEEEEEEEYSVLNPSEDDLALKMSRSYQLNELDYTFETNKIKTEKFSIKIEEPEKRLLTQPNVIKRKFFKTRNLISEQLPDGKEVTIMRDSKNISYLVVDKEKENLITKKTPMNFGLKNARSILKSNYIATTEENNKFNNTNAKKMQTVRMLNNKHTPNITTHEPKTDENKAPKEAIKIEPKAVRQPRKQKIKPVERGGSEIIVQPMYYSFNNDFVMEGNVHKKRKYLNRNSMEVVRVSDDSDPDYTDKPKPKRKKKLNRSFLRKVSEVIAVDSDLESERGSVIEVFSDGEEELKKREKEKDDENVDKAVDDNNDSTDDKKNENDENVEVMKENLDTSDDIMKIQEAVNDIVEERKKAEELKTAEQENKKVNSTENKLNKSTNDKSKGKNIKCPMCPKTFPRQINLKTHMNIHNSRRVLRSKPSPVVEKKETKNNIVRKPINNVPLRSKSFNCTKCDQKFYSEIHLTRHQTVHLDKKVTKTGVILRRSKQFPKPIAVSPKKRQSVATRLLTVKTKPTTEPPKKLSPKASFKCDVCKKSFSLRSLLNAHRTVHKTFACCNCSVKFSTKMLLDEHLRKNCVKTPVRKATLRPTSVKKSVKTMLCCEICRKIFTTVTKLHEHETLEHKNVNKLSNTAKKSKKAHGGVPTSSKMQKALTMMKLRS